MPASLSTIDALLKEVYEDRVQDQVQNEVTALKRVEQTSDGVTETTGGKYVDFPVRVRRNAGIGYRAENGALPVAGQQGFASVHVPLRYGYGRFRLSNQTMELSDSNEKAFAKALDEEQSYLKEDLVKDSARVVYGDGTGLICSITDTAVTTAVHSVDNTQYLELGEIVDVLVRSTGVTVLLNTTINAISGLNVTFGATFTGAVTQGVYRQGNWGLEPSGFANIINDTSVLHTLDPAVEPRWAATLDTNAGTPRALSEGLMIQTCDTVRTKGAKTEVIFTSLGVRRAYFNLLTQQRRYSNTKEFAGGFTGLAFNYGTEIPVVEDVDAPPSKMWFVRDSDLKVYRTHDWEYAQNEGNILKWVVGFDTWEGFMRKYWELGTHRRNGNALVSSIIEG